jgi:CRP/FNR family transcriptional regulator, cyclic AMP receptor protein
MDLLHLMGWGDDAEEYAAGATLFSEGEPGEHMFVVLDGEIEVRVRDNVLETVGPGDILGEMALIDAGARSATAWVRAACRVIRIDRPGFMLMVQYEPRFSLHVMKVLVNRLRRMDRRL